jgi:allophanate hydrolase subunit 1
VHAFRVMLGISAGLVILGGVVALIGIQNPRRRVRSEDCPDGALAPAAVQRTAVPVAAATSRS